MRRTMIRGTIGTLILIAVLAPHDLAQEALPRHAAVEAAWLADVVGDPAAAEALLREELAGATDASRPGLELRLAILLLELGRTSEADVLLGGLAARTDPIGERARAARSRLAPSAPADGDTPVDALVRTLDAAGKPGLSASGQLAYLGDLAAPALVAGLAYLGPIGVPRALELLRLYRGDGFLRALQRMLASEDEFRRVAAAGALGTLDQEARAKLLAIALAADDAPVREAAFRSLAAGAEDGRFFPLTPELRGLAVPLFPEVAESAKSWVRADLAAFLSHPQLAAEPGIDALLVRLMADPVEDVRKRAIGVWVTRRVQADEALAIALLERPELGVARPQLLRMVADAAQLAWADFLVRGLTVDGVESSCLKRLSELGAKVPVALLVPLLGDDETWVRGAALRCLGDRRDPVAVQAVVRVLGRAHDADVPRLWSYLEATAPDQLEANAELLLLRSELRDTALEYFVRAADVHAVRAVIGYLRRFGVDGRTEATLKIIGHRSTHENLPDLLDLASVPITGIDHDWVEETLAVGGQAVADLLAAEDLERVLGRVATLHRSVFLGIREKLVALVRPEHAAALARFVDETLAGWRADDDDAIPNWSRTATSDDRMAFALAALVRLGPMAETTIWKVITTGPASVTEAAFGHLARIEGLDRRATLDRGLARDGLALEPLVAFGMDADRLLATDAELRDRAVARLLRAPAGFDIEAFLRSLPAAELESVARELLADAVRFDSPRAGFAASIVAAVGSRKDAAMVPVLALALASDVASTRLVAASQIGATCAEEAVPVLIQCLKDDDSSVVSMAREGLARVEEYRSQRARWAGVLDR